MRCIGWKHNNLVFRTKFHGSYFYFFSDVNGSNDFKRLFSLSTYFYFIIKSVADENISFWLRVLSCQKMSYFTRMLGQSLHFSAICSVIEWYVSLSIPNQHSFLKKIKVKCRYLVGSNVHIYLFNITIEGAPYFNFVSGWSKETKRLFNISTTDYCIFISSNRIIIFIIVVKPNWLSRKN